MHPFRSSSQMDELDKTMTRYLLGKLSEQEQAALEKRYFADREVFNQLLQVESELVDAHARGQLSTEMRERFERSYLTHPSRRKRVEFAKALTARIDEREQPARAAQSASPVSWWQGMLATLGGHRPALRLSMALAAVLIVLLAGWIFVVVRRQQQEQREAEIQAQQKNQEQREREQTAQQQPTNTPSQSAQQSSSPTTNPTRPVPFLALTVGGVRGGDNLGTQTLIIPHDTTQAQLALKLKDDSYPRYRVSLQKIVGAEVFNRANIRPRNTKTGANFLFTLPASQLSSGEYALTLSGITSTGEVDVIGKSLFRVEKH